MALLTHNSATLKVLGAGVSAYASVGLGELLITGHTPTTTAVPSTIIVVGFGSLDITGSTPNIVAVSPAPTISSINSSTSPEDTVTIQGTDLNAVDSVEFGGETREIVTQTDTELTFVASIGGVPYGTTTVTIKSPNGDDSTTITFEPIAGNSYHTVSNFPPGGDDLSVLSQANPTVENGDQFEFENTTDAGATITMYSDGTFEISATGDHAFQVRAWDQTDSTWGDWTLMEVNQESAITTVGFSRLRINSSNVEVETWAVVDTGFEALSILGYSPTVINETEGGVVSNPGYASLVLSGFSPNVSASEPANQVIVAGTGVLIINTESVSVETDNKLTGGNTSLVVSGLQIDITATKEGDLVERAGVGHLEIRTYKPDLFVTSADAPETITSFVVSSNQIDIEWASYEGADSYTLERDQGDGSGGWINTLRVTGITDTSYSDTDLLADTPYRYRVRAVIVT